MTTRVDTEDISSTKSEKFLAVILAAFILIGSGWMYWKIYDVAGPDYRWDPTDSEMVILEKRDNAVQHFYAVDETYSIAVDNLTQARADLNLAVDRGDLEDALEENYREAQDELARATRERNEARTAMIDAENEAEAVDDAIEARIANAKDSPRNWLVAGLRLALIGVMFLGSLYLVQRLRARESRYLALGLAATASATIMALVFAIDYITDYIDFLELGPVVLSGIGILATIAAFAMLQKYLARRIPRSRVKRGECPFCGFPAAAGQVHCEGCGRHVTAACARCAEPRRVGSPHCASCGKP